ncbi:MAG: phenylacetate-CoA oxygenase subunit PaaC [Gammaproteobacteria bacterium]|nr:phenylacetate-CoA oxygenase subunit PaaC [Gammaproteobacteria bacterium]NNM20765.1 phenylacetate-CoA oxygenase subunit PaaC [Gammaproteobacteria bacterium]
MSTNQDKEMLLAHLLRLGDNALVLGQQLGDWVGHGPELEEEMAMANFALDYIGQARMFYSYAGEVEGRGRSEDDIAFLRDCIDFRNVLLVEQPNGDFAQTIGRHFLFESYYLLYLEQLTQSADQRLAEMAARMEKEIRYHLRHAQRWLIRLGDGTDESHGRMQHAIDELWRYTGELFETDAVDEWAISRDIGPDPSALAEPWREQVAATLTEATINLPEDGWMASGGRAGRHGEHLGYLLADMQFLQRAYPGLSW